MSSLAARARLRLPGLSRARAEVRRGGARGQQVPMRRRGCAWSRGKLEQIRHDRHVPRRWRCRSCLVYSSCVAAELIVDRVELNLFLNSKAGFKNIGLSCELRTYCSCVQNCVRRPIVAHDGAACGKEVSAGPKDREVRVYVNTPRPSPPRTRPNASPAGSALHCTAQISPTPTPPRGRRPSTFPGAADPLRLWLCACDGCCAASRCGLRVRRGRLAHEAFLLE